LPGSILTQPQFSAKDLDLLCWSIRTEDCILVGIDLAGGDTVDFWILTDESFDRSRFARQRIVEVLGLRFPVSPPEDSILMKLHRAELSGGSQKQFTDAPRVYEVPQVVLDLESLNDWASQLGVESL
jgi:hypothetical protein